MENQTVVIPFPLLAARESRISREQEVLKARKYSVKSDCRYSHLILAALFKKHEKQWLEVYAFESGMNK